MRSALFFLIGALCAVVLMALPKAAAHWHGAPRGGGGQGRTGEPRVRTKESFRFTAHAPMERVAPLFGAERERVWAPDWNPEFVHPLPATDEQGMVFTVAHTHSKLKAVWVNTELDEKNGRIQYAYVLPGALATRITIKLTPQGGQTKVDVEYERTALSQEADGQVRHLAEGDRRAGVDWEKQVNGYLGSAPGR